jgi:myo-inositol-1(or 4)-monophosphatase
LSDRELGRARETLVRAVREAGELQLGEAGSVRQIEAKGTQDIVTDVDRRCEERVVRSVRAAHPDHPILAEEGRGTTQTGRAGGPLWVLDPLDGTKNYAHGQPRFACSLALLWDGQPVLGAVLAPALKELFFAERGGGATLNGKAIRVSSTQHLAAAMVATSLTVRNRVEPRQVERAQRLLAKAQAVRSLGCASLDLCDVARGRLDAFLEEGLSPWDTAAGTLLVQEAGGCVTTFSGAAFDLFGLETLAATPAVGAEILGLLSGTR